MRAYSRVYARTKYESSFRASHGGPFNVLWGKDSAKPGEIEYTVYRYLSPVTRNRELAWCQIICSAQVSVRSSETSHLMTTGVASRLNHILWICIYNKHAQDFQDTLNSEYISLCNASSTICIMCIMELHKFLTDFIEVSTPYQKVCYRLLFITTMGIFLTDTGIDFTRFQYIKIS